MALNGTRESNIATVMVEAVLSIGPLPAGRLKSDSKRRKRSQKSVQDAPNKPPCTVFVQLTVRFRSA
jgi:hypothetical protein